jgi:uncharacterized protein YbcV (DUF1398 family)
MNIAIESVIREAASNSNKGLIHFGQVVGMLLEAGVESYHVDYRAGRSTYYLPNNESFTLENPLSDVEIPEVFSAEAIKAAILGAQRGEVMYPQFKKLSQLGGCIGYVVWLTGKHVTYFGRKGEMHIENFPN